MRSSKRHAGTQAAEFAGVRQLDDFISTGLERINFALRHRLLVDVDADGTLTEARQVADLVHSLLPVNIRGLIGPQLGGFRWNQAASAADGVTFFDVIVLDKKTAAGEIDPA